MYHTYVSGPTGGTYRYYRLSFYVDYPSFTACRTTVLADNLQTITCLTCCWSSGAPDFVLLRFVLPCSAIPLAAFYRYCGLPACVVVLALLLLPAATYSATVTGRGEKEHTACTRFPVTVGLGPVATELTTRYPFWIHLGWLTCITLLPCAFPVVPLYTGTVATTATLPVLLRKEERKRTLPPPFFCRLPWYLPAVVALGTYPTPRLLPAREKKAVTCPGCTAADGFQILLSHYRSLVPAVSSTTTLGCCLFSPAFFCYHHCSYHIVLVAFLPLLPCKQNTGGTYRYTTLPVITLHCCSIFTHSYPTLPAYPPNTLPFLGFCLDTQTTDRLYRSLRALP